MSTEIQDFLDDLDIKAVQTEHSLEFEEFDGKQTFVHMFGIDKSRTPVTIPIGQRLMFIAVLSNGPDNSVRIRSKPAYGVMTPDGLKTYSNRAQAVAFVSELNTIIKLEDLEA